MKIFNFNITRNKTPYKTDVLGAKMPTIVNEQFALPPIPVIKEVAAKDWILFGEDNLFPQHLRLSVMQSPTQAAIITGKAGMMSGDGLLINDTKTIDESKAALESLGSSIKAQYEEFLANPNGTEDVHDIISKLCEDYQMFGAYALEVVWSIDFSRISTLKYVSVADIRSGKYFMNKVKEYWYSRDWFYSTKTGYTPKPICSFNEENKEALNQLMYVKNGNLEYYGNPSYTACLSHVEIEGLLANFDLSHIKNGFSPGMSIMFPNKPGSPEEEEYVKAQLRKQYSGTTNAGKWIYMFADGKDNMPTLSPIPVTDLDKQYTAIRDTATQNILTGNRVTSPLLFGISVPGSLGGNTEMQTAFNIFNRAVIEPDRKKIEKTINTILKINKIPVTVNLLPFNPTL